MATKTFTFEIDAYKRLKRAKATEKESFSSVVRRAEFPAAPGTGAAILAFLQKGTVVVPSEKALDNLTRNQLADYANPKMSPNVWEATE